MAKYSLIGFIKGSKSMLFFAKYLTISQIAISNPLTLFFEYNSQKSNNLDRLLRFFNGH